MGRGSSCPSDRMCRSPITMLRSSRHTASSRCVPGQNSSPWPARSMKKAERSRAVYRGRRSAYNYTALRIDCRSRGPALTMAFIIRGVDAFRIFALPLVLVGHHLPVLSTLWHPLQSLALSHAPGGQCSAAGRCRLSALGPAQYGSSLILAHLTMALPVAAWVLTTTFSSIPHEVQKAAAVDGYGAWRILTSIMLPLALPGLAVCGLLVWLLSWNSILKFF